MSAPSLPSLLVTHWAPDPTILVPAIALGALYVAASRRVTGPWPFRRTASFLAGIGCVLVALQSGIDAYDDRLLSVHMIQHMLLLVAAPPMLLAGRPLILALRSLSPRRRVRLAGALARTRGVTAPVPALAVFAAAILLTHLSSFYDATLRHPLLHDSEHVVYLAAGLIMFSPLLDGDPVARHRLGGLGKLVYLIVAMMPMALVGAYLNRHATLIYPAYGPAGHALGVSALDDQAQAGAIMWVLGGVVMTAIGLWSAMAAMVAEERRLVAREARAAARAPRERPAALPAPDRGTPA